MAPSLDRSICALAEKWIRSARPIDVSAMLEAVDQDGPVGFEDLVNDAVVTSSTASRSSELTVPKEIPPADHGWGDTVIKAREFSSCLSIAGRGRCLEG